MHYAALMTDSAALLARAIGARVKQERRVKGLTLDGLAEAAGVSRRMVVNVEQGSVNPSIGTLLRLSGALGVALPALVEPPAPSGGKITRNGSGAQLWTGDLGGAGVLVASTDSPDAFELWDWTLAAGERHASEAHAAGTRELLQVQLGSVVVEVDGVAHELGTGDALAFAGDLAHAYANPGDGPARFSLAVFEPGAGTSHRTDTADDRTN